MKTPLLVVVLVAVILSAKVEASPYYKVSLDSVVNQPSNFIDYPWGEVNFGGIPFRIAETQNMFMTQSELEPNLPDYASFSMQVQSPETVYLLLNAGFLDSAYLNATIGKIVLTYDNGSTQLINLVAGQNIREWSWTDLGGQIITQVTDTNVSEVWKGYVVTSPTAYNRIDMLKIPTTNSSPLTKIELYDLSHNCGVTARDAALMLRGITVQSSVPEPSSFLALGGSITFLGLLKRR